MLVPNGAFRHSVLITLLLSSNIVTYRVKFKCEPADQDFSWVSSTFPTQPKVQANDATLFSIQFPPGSTSGIFSAKCTSLHDCISGSHPSFKTPDPTGSGFSHHLPYGLCASLTALSCAAWSGPDSATQSLPVPQCPCLWDGDEKPDWKGSCEP